ncbi:MAG: DNA primase DnaG [Candidatus Thermoplasmatota archaeon]|nr:DNA primase DnaG [Candidatus Thermoplasmatota archaeon]
MNVDPNLTKYMIKVKITADGVVEKPDVVGAIFGQTEGLLGDELDLRDLQKGGKIGRIEVEIDSKKGRTEGSVLIPSGLDQVETSILAASLETIDRIGPCKAKVDVESVEDVRIQRRQKIVERAQNLYKKMNQGSKNVSESLVQSVREEVEKGEILSYGDEKLPAGPAIKDSDSIIVVEGRSDVLNLLKYGIKNTIAVQGTNIPKTVQELSRQRTVTVFLDGDRGGDLILKEMLQVAEVDFVARAPPGTEVEELTYKQLFKALKYKTPVAQYLAMKGMTEELKELQEKNAAEKDETPKKLAENRHEPRGEPKPEHSSGNQVLKEKPEESVQVAVAKIVEPDQHGTKVDLKDSAAIERRLSTLQKEKLTEVFNEDGEVLSSFQLSEAFDGLSEVKSAFAILTGGVVSQRMVDIAHEQGVRQIYGIKVSNLTKKPIDLKVVEWDRRS